MASYKLSAGIAGVEQSATGMQIIQIAAGEILTFPEPYKESGLIDLEFHGRTVAVFVQDLRVRGSRIDEMSATREPGSGS
jgi:hypothetical protein